MADASPLPSPTAIRQFLRDTARSIQNDLITGKETLDDFLSLSANTSPREAGESIQIAVRKCEGSQKKLVQLIAFTESLRAAEIEQSQEAREGIAAEFARLKLAIEGSTSSLLD